MHSLKRVQSIWWCSFSWVNPERLRGLRTVSCFATGGEGCSEPLRNGIDFRAQTQQGVEGAHQSLLNKDLFDSIIRSWHWCEKFLQELIRKLHAYCLRSAVYLKFYCTFKPRHLPNFEIDVTLSSRYGMDRAMSDMTPNTGSFASTCDNKHSWLNINTWVIFLYSSINPESFGEKETEEIQRWTQGPPWGNFPLEAVQNAGLALEFAHPDGVSLNSRMNVDEHALLSARCATCEVFLHSTLLWYALIYFDKFCTCVEHISTRWAWCHVSQIVTESWRRI